MSAARRVPLLTQAAMQTLHGGGDDAETWKPGFQVLHERGGGKLKGPASLLSETRTLRSADTRRTEAEILQLPNGSKPESLRCYPFSCQSQAESKSILIRGGGGDQDAKIS